jgi:hypothetical protein
VTRYVLDWPALGGHRVFDTLAEAIAYAARIKAARGEVAVLTTDEAPTASAANGSAMPPHSTRTGRSTETDVNHDHTELAHAAASPPLTNGWTCPEGASPSPVALGAELVDSVLESLSRDVDLRIARHAERIREYRRRNADGAYRWPRFTRTENTETGF